MLYILRDNLPMEQPDSIRWQKWMELGKYRIAYDVVGKCEIRTLFTGINYLNQPNPSLFVTYMVGGHLGGHLVPSKTIEMALSCHKAFKTELLLNHH